MKVNNSEEWQARVEVNSHDEYSKACIDFAIDWADAMEEAIANGNELKDVWKDLSYKVAGEHGITGFMYGAAVAELSHAWVHGEELRRLHNLDTQIHDEGERANEEGGTLNPALVTIEGTSNGEA